jgi:hypothetical protein
MLKLAYSWHIVVYLWPLYCMSKSDKREGAHVQWGVTSASTVNLFDYY